VVQVLTSYTEESCSFCGHVQCVGKVVVARYENAGRLSLDGFHSSIAKICAQYAHDLKGYYVFEYPDDSSRKVAVIDSREISHRGQVAIPGTLSEYLAYTTCAMAFREVREFSEICLGQQGSKRPYYLNLDSSVLRAAFGEAEDQSREFAVYRQLVEIHGRPESRC
jgi:hypothetical protein